MVVPTGTASPWSELLSHTVMPGQAIFFRDGWDTGSADLLAEALRADGIVRTLGRAIPIAEAAELQLAHYGYVDEADEAELCSPEGETANGETVEQVFRCVTAKVETTET